MPSPSASTWPTSGGGPDVVTPAKILWKSVKTEEEEYLDKLQSKLSHIMKNGPMSSALRAENVDVDPDDMTDVPPALPHDHDEDPGLHLLYGFPSTDRRSPSPTPRSQLEPAPTPASRPRLVRFRSRVRITSGVHPSTSGASSSCESISSSISAPLQGLRRESNGKAAPLSSMLSTDAASAWLRRLGHAHKSTREAQRRTPAAVDERSPLSSGGDSRVYTEPDDGQDDSAEYEHMRAAARKTEEEVMFGRWPWRLINRHWWWWKIEPVLCCCARFDDDWDGE